MAKAVKKRGRKPGVKVGPYKKSISNAKLAELTLQLKTEIIKEIKHLNNLLKRI